MVNYLLILAGMISIIIGGRFLLEFIFELTNKVQKIEHLLEDERFSQIENVARELDELNYSYYEILNDITNRMDALVERVDQDLSPKVEMSVEANIATSDKHLEQDDLSVPPKNSSQSERIQICAMVDAGFDDNQIAKALGIGSGKVHIIRKLNSHSNR